MRLIGREIRGIRFERKIGAGAMGAVYLGRLSRSKRGLEAGAEVAVKVLHPHLAGDADSLARFKREAGVGLTLRHPNIVKIHQVGSDRIDGETVHFLVQEYIEGTDLKSLIRETCLLNDPFLRKMAAQVVDALGQIHERGIVHRDLKPENIFLEQDGDAKLVDFGFSHVEKVLRSTASTGFLGTVAYAAPERFGSSGAQPVSDLYSLGVILYELATGVNPFLGEDLTSTIALHMYETPEPPHSLNPHVSRFMSLFIMSLLEKDPALRLGPANRLKRILDRGEASRWWKSLGPDVLSSPVGPRRQGLNVNRRTPVFGRDREIGFLESRFEEVARGEGMKAICLVGEAGSGKTRLVDGLLEVLDREDRPGRFLMVEGAQSSIKLPYQPLVTAVQSAFGLKRVERHGLREEFLERLSEVFPNRKKMAARFADFLTSALPDSEGEGEVMGPELTARLFIELFAALASKEPLILLVENILEADPSTFHVITRMLAPLKDERILLLITTRPGETFAAGSDEENPLETLYDAMDQAGARDVLKMKRLDRSSVTLILTELGFPEKVAYGPFGERVFAVTEGNPYQVLEIARLVVSENRVGHREVDWHGLLAEIPSSIQDAFYRRLFRLPALERSFLDFASVIGMRFQVDEVVDGLGLDFKDAARAVSTLQNRYALIRPAGGVYRFDHSLIRELLYNRIDPDDRAYFHCRVGEHYDALGKGRELTGREHYRACLHYTRGNDGRRALSHFQQAFDYLRYMDLHDRAYQLVESAATQIEALGVHDADFACDLYLKQAEVAGMLGHRGVQIKALKAALQAVKQSESMILKALVRLRIGQYYHARSQFISALNFIEGALDWMRRIGDKRGEADALQALADVLKEIGDDEEVSKHLKTALTLRKELDDTAGQAGVLVAMGEYFLDRAKPVAAREAFLKARRIFLRLKNGRGLASVLLGVARLEMARGSFKVAENILSRAGRVARDVGDAALEADILADLGACQVRRLEYARAERSLAEAVRIAAMMKDVARQVRFLTARARLHLDPEFTGRLPEAALSLARRAVTLSRGTHLPLKDRFQALKTLAQVYLAMGRELSAFAIFRKARRIVIDEGGPEELKAEIRPHFDRLAKRLKKDKPRSILP